MVHDYSCMVRDIDSEEKKVTQRRRTADPVEDTGGMVAVAMQFPSPPGGTLVVLVVMLLVVLLVGLLVMVLLVVMVVVVAWAEEGDGEGVEDDAKMLER
jgi:hypothetical protein